LFDHSLI